MCPLFMGVAYILYSKESLRLRRRFFEAHLLVELPIIGYLSKQLVVVEVDQAFTGRFPVDCQAILDAINVIHKELLPEGAVFEDKT